MKLRTAIFLMVVLLLLSLFIISSTDLFIPREDNEVYDISVIINDSDGERWTNFRSGMDQAAKEMNANISFVTLYDKNSLEQQIELLKREIDDGADAVLISAANSKKLSEALNEMVIEIPVLAIDSKLEGKQVKSYISSDNFKMGEKLGQEIQKNAKEKETVLILKSNMNSSNISERYEGLLSVLNNSSHSYDVLNLDKISEKDKVSKILLTYLDENSPDITVALDESTIEGSLNAMEQLSTEEKIHLYGIGQTNRIVYNLEMENINSIIVSNMFTMGYLGIKNAVDAILQKPVKDKIELEFGVIDKENMYSIKNQRLLFPVP
ncbi:monosaccharide ABC transporter substrate-binding protein (CUT2 family) [Mobilisporobacter senegalensis]|uniref:Monosaccharide ABC transporter substrate-binding protein (CUT2 family) n=1 Tax=Mobilisporobacter senegalensis TaxID=1329262 RepID=A0A3N1XYM3_9FIRM|nr:substrate-binding domain-containing protein [Mobilisporobacter senegalensis]ROR31703.1 monosaccharide ABC transporter substrate-binding protein (CUT2 family) [Mobilisporobacter senegalensis]